MLGFLTANLVGRSLLDFGEMILGRMPVVRGLYRSVKQIFETVFSQSGTSFRTVGLVQFPTKGMWSIVFISTPPLGEMAERLPGPEEHVAVFLPCTPNPDDGLLLLPAAQRSDRAVDLRGGWRQADHVRRADPARWPAKLAASPRPARAECQGVLRFPPSSESATATRWWAPAACGEPRTWPQPLAGRELPLTRPQQPHRLVALEEIEQRPQRLAAFASRGRGRAPATSFASSRAAASSSPCSSGMASRNPGMPDCRVPSTSPSPRRRRSSSAISKPSSVRRMVSIRARAVSPSPPCRAAGRSTGHCRARRARAIDAAGRARTARRARSP